MSDLPRRKVLSLSILAQVQVIRQLHRRAFALATEMKNLSHEDLLYFLDLDFDTEAFVATYESVEPDLIQQEDQTGSTLRREETESRQTLRRSKRKTRRVVPYNYPVLEATEESSDEAYMKLWHEKVQARLIKYRKCKYVESIKEVRRFLTANLSPSTMNDLMTTMDNMVQYKNIPQHGLLTLQAMLMSSNTRRFQCPLFSAFPSYLNIETRIDMTLLRFTLINGQNLTHLNLKNCCYDSILQVVADVSPNLRWLNVSRSRVSDQGLLYLCGVKSGPARSSLTRRCKAAASDKREAVEDEELPHWTKKHAACQNLEHFEGKDLWNLKWPPGQCIKFMKERGTPVPLGSALVAIVMFMPKLKSFDTDVGGRVIQSWLKVAPKRPKQKLPVLEILSESQMTISLLEKVNGACPNLLSIRVDWHAEKDTWTDGLLRFTNLKQLVVNCDLDYNFNPNKLMQVLPAIGTRLTVLKLKELQDLKYSSFQSIRTCCPNLMVLSITMKMLVIWHHHAMLLGSYSVIEKDRNLQLNCPEQGMLKRLQELHLRGAIGNDLVKYLLEGADDLKCLSLGSDWSDPHELPANSSDMLGPEYMKKLLAVNKLRNLEVIHLLAQRWCVHNRLNLACAEMILEEFPKIRHIGNFKFWALTLTEKLHIMKLARSINRDIIFDEDLDGRADGSFVGGNVEYKYVENRHSLEACGHVTPSVVRNLTSSSINL